MGIRIDGASDLINATDGSLTIEGQSINSTGIGTFSGGVKVGSAATIHSTGQFNIGVAATIFANGNATYAGIVTASNTTISSTGIGIGAATNGSANYPSVTISGNSGGAIHFEDDGDLMADIYGDASGLTLSTRKTNDAILFQLNSGSVSEKARITSAGRLLIGGTTSTTVWGYGQGSLQVIGDYQGGSASFINNEANTNSNAITLAKTRNGAIVSDNDTCGALTFSADDGNGYSPCARIMGQVDGTPGDGDMPGRMIFSTTPDGSATLVERMRIRANGNVAINNSTGSILELTRTSTSTSGLCGKLVFGNTDWDSSIASIQSYQDGANDSGSLRFHTQSTGAAEVEYLRIHSNGQVTMGNSHTASSTHKMRVYQTGTSGGIELLGDASNYAGQYVSGLSHETHCTTTENAKNAHMIYSSYHASKSWTYYFPHDAADHAVRIHFPDNSTWVSGYIYLSSTFSYENASGLLTYSFTLNSNGTSNYNRHIAEETDLGGTDTHFSMSTGSAGYSFKGWADNGGTSSENTHALEIRRDGSNGGNHLRVTMVLMCDAAANHIKKAYMTSHADVF